MLIPITICLKTLYLAISISRPKHVQAELDHFWQTIQNYGYKHLEICSIIKRHLNLCSNESNKGEYVLRFASQQYFTQGSD